jgi:stage II sporulation protein P
LIIIAAAILFLTASFFLIKWLYWDGNSEAAMEVFDYSEDTENISRYSGNVFINIINTTIPAAKASYESKYGQELPGFASTISSNLLNGMNFDIRDPKTYFSFVFTAFSQYDPNNSEVSWSGDGDKLPDITNFKDAPDGAIYFSEEDEYMAEETAGGGGETVEGESPQELENLGDPARLEIEKKAPSILMLHTHSMESYSPFNANNYHSSNDNQNVVMVGNIMTDILEGKYKYNVIHDKTRHDKVSYADSYINSLTTIKTQLSKNASVKVVLDVHRDAFAIKGEGDAKARKQEYTTKINGKDAARVMLVIGQNNPNYTELKKFAVYVEKKMEKLYPGLFLKVVTKNGKYNQYYRDHSLLIEVGCMLNTDAEAKYSAELMGNVLGEVMKELEE